MRVKVIDSSLIADKALDVYAANNSIKEDDAEVRKNFVPTSTKSSVLKVFKEVFNSSIDGYMRTYDKVVVVFPCFPLMRMSGSPSIMTRYICKNSAFLRTLGISSNQFLDYFEKFVQNICSGGEITTLNDGKVILLKERYALLKDWTEALVNRFGMSIIDLSIESPFLNNPKFILTMESDLSIFNQIPDDVKEKCKKIVDMI